MRAILRGGSWGAVKFISESNNFHIKSKVIKILSCKQFAALLDPPLLLMLTRAQYTNITHCLDKSVYLFARQRRYFPNMVLEIYFSYLTIISKTGKLDFFAKKWMNVEAAINQRVQNVVSTSIRFKRRWIDVQKTSCVNRETMYTST